MKHLTSLLFLTLLMSIPLQAGHERVLFVPFDNADQSDEPWAGLTLMLAIQNQVRQKERLVPFTACRKKLNEYGLSVVNPLSVATKLKLARDLDADRLVFGAIEGDVLRIMVHDLVHGTTTGLDRELDEQGPGAAISELSSLVGLDSNNLSERHYELFRVWASTYFTDDLETARGILDRLISQEEMGWLFMQEYLEMFGDPIPGLTDDDEMAYWRDLFLQKRLPARALKVSKKLMARRHHIEDLAVHADILLAMGEEKEACTYLKRAEAAGHAVGDLRSRVCQGGYQTDPSADKVR